MRYGAHRAIAARWLARAREHIFDQVAEQVRERAAAQSI
jgi:hypothetical protein